MRLELPYCLTPGLREPGAVLAFPIQGGGLAERLQYIEAMFGSRVVDAWHAKYAWAMKTSPGLAPYLVDVVIGGRLDELDAIVRWYLRQVPGSGPSRPGRRPGDGAYADEALLDEMHRLIERREASSVTVAARGVAHRAKGNSSEAIVIRLRRKYYKRYPRHAQGAARDSDSFQSI
jgi:hypothetical protein